MESSKEYSFAKFFMFFIIIQPIIDILTFVGIEHFGLSITPGIIIRMVVLAFGSLVLMKKIMQNNNKNLGIYLVLLGIFMLINLLTSYFNKPIFSLFSEVSMIAKHLYTVLMFIIMTKSIAMLFDESNNIKKNRIFPMILVGNAIIINITFVIATLTQTGKQTYNALYKVGHTAWFFAGNEIGSILSILLPILLLNIFLVKSKQHKISLWIVFFLTITSMATIGTKVSSFSILITLIMAILTNILVYFLSKTSKKIRFVGTSRDRVILLLTLIIVSISFPYLPAMNNSSSEYQARLERSQSTEDTEPKKTESSTIEDEEGFFGASGANEEVTVSDVVYSGRSGFLEMNKKYYSEAPLVQKVFGMGYASNYESQPKLVERDLHDMFFQFGIIGSVLLLFPFFYYGFKVLKIVLGDILYFMNIKYIMLFTSLILGLGVSFFGGHVLFSPSVSVYLCYGFAYLIVLTNNREVLYYEEK